MRKENEELIKSMPDPDQPPGHRKLPDEEKEKTLTLLKESKLKYLQSFFRLSLKNGIRAVINGNSAGIFL